METAELVQKKRLIVLLPESLAGSTLLAHKIYSMAALNHQDVLYLVLLEDKNNTLEFSRYMTTMKAATTGESLDVVYKLSNRAYWLNDLRANYQPGDVVLCQEEQTVKVGFMRTQRMQSFLEDTLRMPAATLAGFYQPRREQIRQWMFGLLFWASAIIVLAAFLLLEIKIEQATFGVWRTSLLVLAISIEFAILSGLTRIPKI